MPRDILTFKTLKFWPFKISLRNEMLTFKMVCLGLQYESTPKPLKFEDKFHYEDLPSPIAKTEQNRVERGPIRKVPKPDFDTSSPTDHHGLLMNNFLFRIENYEILTVFELL